MQRTPFTEAAKKVKKQIEQPQYLISQCVYCQHLSSIGCAAFKEGIPNIILNNLHDHRNPYNDDNGIQFSKNEKFKEMPITITSLDNTFPPKRWTI